jgi:hypothetical protein
MVVVMVASTRSKDIEKWNSPRLKSATRASSVQRQHLFVVVAIETGSAREQQHKIDGTTTILDESLTSNKALTEYLAYQMRQMRYTSNFCFFRSVARGREESNEERFLGTTVSSYRTPKKQE